MVRLNQAEWQGWIRVRGEEQHRHRFPLMRAVRYELSEPIDGQGAVVAQERAGITVNVSNGGLCFLTDWAPSLPQVIRIHIPMTGGLAETPTLAEVRWVRAMPFEPEGLYLVGLKFVL